MPEKEGPTPTTTRTASAPSCERCRERKVKCVPKEPVHDDAPSRTDQTPMPCVSCERRNETCSFNYTYKKPGRPKKVLVNANEARSPNRPRSSGLSQAPEMGRGDRTSNGNTSARTRSASPTRLRLDSLRDPFLPAPIPFNHNVPLQADPIPEASSSTIDRMPFVPNNSFFGSARRTLQSPAIFSFDYTLPNSSRHEESHPTDRFRPSQYSPASPLHESQTQTQPEMDTLQQFFREIDNTPMSFLSDSLVMPETFNDGMNQNAQTIQSSYLGEPQSNVPDTDLGLGGSNGDHLTRLGSISSTPAHIEAVASWGDVSFFIALHVKYQHALVPLCHQPTFAKDILYRRDQTDEAFRCFLFSIVSYTICQCPVDMLLKRMDREQLELLVRKCQRASRIIQIRHQRKPSLLILASTILDWITSQAMTSAELSDILLHDVRRLVYRLNLRNLTPREGLSNVELELCRRVYWQAYVNDKTNALNGHPIMLHDAEGLPPLPSEVDDELITPVLGQQPEGTVSYMIGFNAIARIFQMLYQCLWHTRTFLQANPLSLSLDKPLLDTWADSTKRKLDDLLSVLPPPLRPDFRQTTDGNSLFGMQAANILITALCLELALLDLQSSLFPDRDTSTSRQNTAKRVLEDLEKIPIQCLALNGESMRGKVLRVILTLLNASDRSPALAESAGDWWSMYSRVQFLQVIPAQAPPVVPTRPHSPG